MPLFKRGIFSREMGLWVSCNCARKSLYKNVVSTPESSINVSLMKI
jgi:hypothetical protein